MAAVAEKGTLNDSEKLLLESIRKSNVTEILRILNEKETRIDCLDENGMTPLQHAAYRGNKELCKLFLDRGADVNSNQHDHGYTALMFAALSGNTNVVSLLLQAGASTSAVNTVGRNAAQMAAFVGNHACVSTINNFVPRSEVYYYTEIHGLETEPHLSVTLAGPLHRLILEPYIHPVGIALFVQNNPMLLDCKVSKVLSLMCEREVKRVETNEVLALKFHFIGYTIDACERLASVACERKKGISKIQFLDDVMKHWLKGRDVDAFPENLERFVRQSIRDFPYVQCPIVQQLVRNIAPIPIGEEPTALNLLTSSICSQRFTNDDADSICTTCGRRSARKKCSACKSVVYCDQKCQKLHWFTHKKQCHDLAVEYVKEQESIEKLNTKMKSNSVNDAQTSENQLAEGSSADLGKQPTPQNSEE